MRLSRVGLMLVAVLLSLALSAGLAAPRARGGRQVAGGGETPTPTPVVPAQAPVGDPAQNLLTRLEAKQPVTVVCMGDSITDGYDLPDPGADAFPALLRRMIEERWGAAVSMHAKGVPGNTTSGALNRFADDVAPLSPQLVVLQFGGNDKGFGDGLANLPGYQKNLRQLVGECRNIGAAAIVCTPPMHEPVTDMPFPVAARRVAQELHVPAADLDGALKAAGFDYRGLFPYFQHPKETGHAQMALEIYRALGILLGRPLTSNVAIDAAVRPDCKLGGFSTVPLRVSNTTEKARQAVMRGDAILSFQDGPLEVPAGAETLRFLPLALPHTLSGGRSLEWPLWASATFGDETAFGLARITAVPVMGCPNARLHASRVPFATLNWAHLTVGTQMGRSNWKGERDLSANIFLGCDETALYITVDVADDIVKTDVAMPFGDGIEVFLDLRADADRGRPYYSKQCAGLFIGASAPDKPCAITCATDDQTAPELMALKPVCTTTTRGYRIGLALPRAVLDKVGGHPVKALGLDIGVDDCDDTSRKQQMIWLGRADNYVNPRRLGELRLDQQVEPGTVRVTVF